MNKKEYAVILLSGLLVVLFLWEGSLKSREILQDNLVEQAIRLRILANSNLLNDQWAKKKVTESFAPQITELLKAVRSREEARERINSVLPQLNMQLNEQLDQLRMPYKGTVSLTVAPFPMKGWQGGFFNAGEYETLIIRLGEGKGDNFWCLLFPQVCFMDIEGRRIPQIVKGEMMGGKEEKPRFFIIETFKQGEKWLFE
jgi:stage II sporulation protein R